MLYAKPLLFLFAACTALADNADNDARDALPLCPGHVQDVFSITGWAVQLHPDSDVLEIEVSYKHTLPVTPAWYAYIKHKYKGPGAEWPSFHLFSLRSNDDFNIIDEKLSQRGEGRTAMKTRWSKLQKSMYERPSVEFRIQRENGVAVSVNIDFSKLISISGDLVTSNRRLNPSQTFSVLQLPPAEYDRNTNNCKMQVLVKTFLINKSPGEARVKRDMSEMEEIYDNMTLNNGPYDKPFEIKSLQDYPSPRGQMHQEFTGSYHQKATRMEDEKRLMLELVFVPDSQPESDVFENTGYSFNTRFEADNLNDFSLTASSRRNLGAAEEAFVEGGSDIREGGNLLGMTFFGKPPAAELPFHGSVPSEMVCQRRFSGMNNAPRSSKVSIQVFGRSSVPQELRNPASQIAVAYANGTLEWAFFSMDDPAWLLMHRSRCRCRHKLTDGGVIYSPWREVLFSSPLGLKTSSDVRENRRYAPFDLPTRVTFTCSAARGTTLKLTLSQDYDNDVEVTEIDLPELNPDISRQEDDLSSTLRVSFMLSQAMFYSEHGQYPGVLSVTCEGSKGGKTDRESQSLFLHY